MHICPQCGQSLTREQGPDGLQWRCHACDGRALTVAMLRKWLTPTAVNELWIGAGECTAPDGRPCPDCGGAMRLVTATTGRRPVQVDLCRTCSLAWFDAHEYEALPERVKPPPPPELPAKAREAVAMVQAEAIRHRYEHMPSRGPENATQAALACLGLPVETDGPACRQVPWVTITLALAVLGVSVYALYFQPALIKEYSFIPSQIARHGWLTLLTPFFLHGSLWHLLGNLYFFIIFGDNAEDDLGWWRYLGLLVVGTVVGNLCHAAWGNRPDTPCIGASGGISGVMAYYAAKYPSALIGLYVGPWHARLWLELPAMALFILWLLLQGVGVMLQLSGFSNVSALAHLGGVAVGIAAWAIRRICASTPAQPRLRARGRGTIVRRLVDTHHGDTL